MSNAQTKPFKKRTPSRTTEVRLEKPIAENLPLSLAEGRLPGERIDGRIEGHEGDREQLRGERTHERGMA